MVYGFVKQAAGHITIYSEEGHGTTIKIYLPPGTGASLAPEAAATPVIPGGHKTILVVEDDKLVRDSVLTQLRSLGYVTLEAANGAEALAVIGAGHPFDLLFTDVIMPGAMNGRQLANEVQKSKPGLKVLFTLPRATPRMRSSITAGSTPGSCCSPSHIANRIWLG
jgi:CheY-like chemotaxis protein